MNARRAILTLADKRMLQHRCGRCLADPGDWCSTARGSRSSLLHAARFYAAQAAGDLPLTEAEVSDVLQPAADLVPASSGSQRPSTESAPAEEPR